MPLLSVITPAWAPSEAHVEFLLETYESLSSQESLGGWDWEWLIQEDGEQPRLRERLPNDLRIRYAAIGVRLGAATCRTLALERARGEVTRSLDADDVLLN
ncbi:MAG: glycosyltransferase, partial [Pseudonocardiaceae bacterium]